MHFVVIEDHALIFESLVLHLQNSFSGAHATHMIEFDLDGIEALRPIDCVVFDPNLGSGNRYDRIGKLKDLMPDVPVVVLTADVTDAAPRLARAFGASAFISKDDPSQTLNRKIEMIVTEGQQVFPDQMGQDGHDKLSDPLLNAALTPRERDVVKCLVNSGVTNKSMARHFGISESTIKYHLGHAYRKLGVGNRTEAVLLLNGAQSAARPPERPHQPV